MESNDDESSKELNSSSSSAYGNGINGEPEIVPRVGKQYQAEIPKLISNRLKKSENLITFGLPIPLMWSRSEKFKGFHEISPEPEQEQPTRKTMKRRSVVLALPCQRNVKLKSDLLDKCLYPFPGILAESWKVSEKERFLLGLYCLGKNLVLVQRFVGSKQMGDLLSYYYGSFYRSNEYRRWFDGRKSRSRKSVQGQKLFTGWRLQELISRVSSNVSEERKSILLKVTKEFKEEKIGIEEFVFALKETIGVDLFTEAIGIGKGKRDLTNSALDPPTSTKNSEVVRIRNDLPVSDIVKFLTGEYRLSKTKSCDLFWEAVWPRLLARGWHSEQPKDTHSLVFLIPEAQKFSRRKMSKGKDYFDSLTDVLNRVKLDPTLLELQTDEEERGKEEIKIVDDDEDDDDGKMKKRYLQPRVKPSKTVQEFTIMDTSNVNGVKAVRSLPVGVCDSREEETTMASRVCGGGSNTSSVNMENVMKPKKNKGGRPRNQPVCAKRSSLADCTLRDSVCFGETEFKKKKKKMKLSSEEDSSQERVKKETEADQTMKLSEEEDDSLCRRKQEGEEERGIASSSLSPERRKPRENDFDLNVPQIEHEDDTVVTEVKQNSERSCAEQMEDLVPERRQSTRTRPLTTKALEAYAFGFLGNSNKKKQKASEDYDNDDSSRSKSRRKRKASEEDDDDEPRSKSRRKSTKPRMHRPHSVVLSSKFRNGTVEDGSNTDDDE